MSLFTPYHSAPAKFPAPLRRAGKSKPPRASMRRGAVRGYASCQIRHCMLTSIPDRILRPSILLHTHLRHDSFAALRLRRLCLMHSTVALWVRSVPSRLRPFLSLGCSVVLMGCHSGAIHAFAAASRDHLWSLSGADALARAVIASPTPLGDEGALVCSVGGDIANLDLRSGKAVRIPCRHM